MGGQVNAFSPTVYFLLIATFLLLLQLAHSSAEVDGRLRGLSTAVVGAVMIVLIGVSIPIVRELGLMVRVFRKNQEQSAYDWLRKNPTRAYFPNNPLAHLMAERRLYHFSYGMLDRRLAGYPLSTEHFLAHVPPAMQAVVFCTRCLIPEIQTRDETMQYLPDFVDDGVNPDGFWVYVPRRAPSGRGVALKGVDSGRDRGN